MTSSSDSLNKSETMDLDNSEKLSETESKSSIEKKQSEYGSTGLGNSVQFFKDNITDGLKKDESLHETALDVTQLIPDNSNGSKVQHELSSYSSGSNDKISETLEETYIDVRAKSTHNMDNLGVLCPVSAAIDPFETVLEDDNIVQLFCKLQNEDTEHPEPDVTLTEISKDHIGQEISSDTSKFARSTAISSSVVESGFLSKQNTKDIFAVPNNDDSAVTFFSNISESLYNDQAEVKINLECDNFAQIIQSATNHMLERVDTDLSISNSSNVYTNTLADVKINTSIDESIYNDFVDDEEFEQALKVLQKEFKNKNSKQEMEQYSEKNLNKPVYNTVNNDISLNLEEKRSPYDLPEQVLSSTYRKSRICVPSGDNYVFGSKIANKSILDNHRRSDISHEMFTSPEPLLKAKKKLPGIPRDFSNAQTEPIPSSLNKNRFPEIHTNSQIKNERSLNIKGDLAFEIPDLILADNMSHYILPNDSQYRPTSNMSSTANNDVLQSFDDLADTVSDNVLPRNSQFRPKNNSSSTANNDALQSLNSFEESEQTLNYEGRRINNTPLVASNNSDISQSIPIASSMRITSRTGSNESHLHNNISQRYLPQSPANSSDYCNSNDYFVSSNRSLSIKHIPIMKTTPVESSDIVSDLSSSTGPVHNKTFDSSGIFMSSSGEKTSICDSTQSYKPKKFEVEKVQTPNSVIDYHFQEINSTFNRSMSAAADSSSMDLNTRKTTKVQEYSNINEKECQFLKEGHAICRFGAGNVFITMIPQSIDSSSTDQNNLAFEKYQIVFRRLETDLDEVGFPGPLMTSKGPDKSKAKDLLKWMYGKIQQLEQQIGSGIYNASEEKDKLKLWSVILILLENKGNFDENARKSICNLFDEPISQGFISNIQEKTALQIGEVAPLSSSDALLLANKISKGERPEALNYAIELKAWLHALIIANSMGHDIYMSTLNTIMKEDSFLGSSGTTSDLLNVMYAMISGGDGKILVDAQSTKKVAPNWSHIVKTILINDCKYWLEALHDLGGILEKENFFFASQICFALSIPITKFVYISQQDTVGIFLPGGNFKQYGYNILKDRDALFLNEILEYLLALRTPSVNITTHTLPYKFIRAVNLVDQGYLSRAQKYIEYIANSLAKLPRDSFILKSALLQQTHRLSERIFNVQHLDIEKSSDSSWLGKSSGLKMDKFWTSLESKLSKFVAGESPNRQSAPDLQMRHNTASNFVETRSSSHLSAEIMNFNSSNTSSPRQQAQVNLEPENMYTNQKDVSPLSTRRASTDVLYMSKNQSFRQITELVPSSSVSESVKNFSDSSDQVEEKFEKIDLGDETSKQGGWFFWNKRQETQPKPPEPEDFVTQKPKKLSTNPANVPRTASWFSWGKKKEETVYKAKLGEESSFYYDKDLKRWVNKTKTLENVPEQAAPPPKSTIAKKATTSAHLNVQKASITNEQATDAKEEGLEAITMHKNMNDLHARVSDEHKHVENLETYDGLSCQNNTQTSFARYKSEYPGTTSTATIASNAISAIQANNNKISSGSGLGAIEPNPKLASSVDDLLEQMPMSNSTCRSKTKARARYVDVMKEST